MLDNICIILGIGTKTTLFFSHFSDTIILYIDIYLKSMFHVASPIHVCNGRLIYWYGTMYELYVYTDIIRIKIPERKKQTLLSIIYNILYMCCVLYISYSIWFIFPTNNI